MFEIGAIVFSVFRCVMGLSFHHSLLLNIFIISLLLFFNEGRICIKSIYYAGF